MARQSVVKDQDGHERYRSPEGLTEEEGQDLAEKEAEKLREQQPENEYTVKGFGE